MQQILKGVGGKRVGHERRVGSVTSGVRLEDRKSRQGGRAQLSAAEMHLACGAMGPGTGRLGRHRLVGVFGWNPDLQ